MRYKPRIGVPWPWGSDHRPRRRRRAHDTHGGAVSRDHGCVRAAAEALGCGGWAPDVAVGDEGGGGGGAPMSIMSGLRGGGGIGEEEEEEEEVGTRMRSARPREGGRGRSVRGWRGAVVGGFWGGG